MPEMFERTTDVQADVYTVDVLEKWWYNIEDDEWIVSVHSHPGNGSKGSMLARTPDVDREHVPDEVLKWAAEMVGDEVSDLTTDIESLDATRMEFKRRRAMLMDAVDADDTNENNG